MDRPFVQLNVAATADGKIDTVQRRGAAISSQQDKARVDRLRADSDAIMVGGKTLHHEDPSLTVKSETLRNGRLAKGLPANPAKVGVSSRLDLRRDCKFLSSGPARIILFTTTQTPPAQLDLLKDCGADVHILGQERVDLVQAMAVLAEAGIKRLMLEGGATLNAEMLRLGLVDEMTIYLAPFVFGGKDAPTLAGGAGLPSNLAIALELLRVERWDDGGVLLHYRLKERAG